MKRLSWKYMAGLVDGEGCIDMQVNRDKAYQYLYLRPRLRMTLAGDEIKPLLDMCAANFGGSVQCKPHKEGSPVVWKTPYAWCITGKGPLRAFLQNIANHLWIKKEQAKFAIWWIDTMCGKHLTEEVRECAKAEMKAMKNDPQRLSERAARKIEALFAQDQANKQWSRSCESCVECGRTDSPHQSNGVCRRCCKRKKRADAIVQPIQVMET